MSSGSSDSSLPLLNCGLCRSMYRQPRILTCLHTFCLPCLQQLPIHCDNNDDDDDHDHHQQQRLFLLCPQCKGHTRITSGDLSDLTPNEFMARMCQEYVTEVQKTLGTGRTFSSSSGGGSSPSHGPASPRSVLAGRSLFSPAQLGSGSGSGSGAGSPLESPRSRYPGVYSPKALSPSQSMAFTYDSAAQSSCSETYQGSRPSLEMLTMRARQRRFSLTPPEVLRIWEGLQRKLNGLQSASLQITYGLENVNMAESTWFQRKQDLRREVQRRSAQLQFFIKRQERLLLAMLDSKDTDQEFLQAADQARDHLRSNLKSVVHETEVIKNVVDLAADSELMTLGEHLLSSPVSQQHVSMAFPELHFKIPEEQSVEDQMGEEFGCFTTTTVTREIYQPEAIEQDLPEVVGDGKQERNKEEEEEVRDEEVEVEKDTTPQEEEEEKKEMLPPEEEEGAEEKETSVTETFITYVPIGVQGMTTTASVSGIQDQGITEESVSENRQEESRDAEKGMEEEEKGKRTDEEEEEEEEEESEEEEEEEEEEDEDVEVIVEETIEIVDGKMQIISSRRVVNPKPKKEPKPAPEKKAKKRKPKKREEKKKKEDKKTEEMTDETKTREDTKTEEMKREEIKPKQPEVSVSRGRDPHAKRTVNSSPASLTHGGKSTAHTAASAVASTAASILQASAINQRTPSAPRTYNAASPTLTQPKEISSKVPDIGGPHSPISLTQPKTLSSRGPETSRPTSLTLSASAQSSGSTSQEFPQTQRKEESTEEGQQAREEKSPNRERRQQLKSSEEHQKTLDKFQSFRESLAQKRRELLGASIGPGQLGMSSFISRERRVQSLDRRSSLREFVYRPPSPPEPPQSQDAATGGAKFSSTSTGSAKGQSSLQENLSSTNQDQIPSESSKLSPLSPTERTSRPVRRAVSAASDKATKMEFLRETWKKRKEILIQNDAYITSAETKDGGEEAGGGGGDAKGQDEGASSPLTLDDVSSSSSSSRSSRVSQKARSRVTDMSEALTGTSAERGGGGAPRGPEILEESGGGGGGGAYGGGASARGGFESPAEAKALSTVDKILQKKSTAPAPRSAKPAAVSLDTFASTASSPTTTNTLPSSDNTTPPPPAHLLPPTRLSKPSMVVRPRPRGEPHTEVISTTTTTTLPSPTSTFIPTPLETLPEDESKSPPPLSPSSPSSYSSRGLRASSPGRAEASKEAFQQARANIRRKRERWRSLSLT